MEVIHNETITVDFQLKNENAVPRYFQNDNNVLTVYILDNGNPADLSNVSRIVINFKRRDGSIISRSITSFVENVVKIELGNEEQKQDGLVLCNLQVYDLADRLTSFPFKIFFKCTVQDNQEYEDDDVTMLNQLVGEVDSLKMQVIAATTEAEIQAAYAKEQGDYAKEQAKNLTEFGVSSINGMSGAVTLNMEGLKNVGIENITDGQVLAYDSDTGKWVNTDRDELPITITDASDNDILSYDADTSQWVNLSISSLVSNLEPSLNTLYAAKKHKHVLSDVDDGTEMNDAEVETIWTNTSPDGV